jgi:benzoyl-CoA reductase/2-hydroxyglutaryl-CoA dehydratase subunit BcrC/BadD/HgdB
LATLSPVQLQDIVASAMIMDPAEHAGLLAEALAGEACYEPDDRVRVHLSGHLCHAPRRELLETIEASGAVVVDDDLYHGRRYVSTDVEEDGDPFEAIARWYQQRNVNIPCPTRVQQDVDWDGWLIDAVRRSGAEAVIHLLPKFCEPHMLYYPELRKALDGAGIPHLQIETEHEGLPLESFRTRIEALVERAHRNRAVLAAGAT